MNGCQLDAHLAQVRRCIRKAELQKAVDLLSKLPPCAAAYCAIRASIDDNRGSSLALALAMQIAFDHAERSEWG